VPRPSKTVHRQKIAAGLEWKKGNREEAKKMWADSDKARKELQAKKRNKKKPAEEKAPDQAEGEASTEG
jgi:hypothetical protein